MNLFKESSEVFVEFSIDEIKDLLDAFEERNMQKLQLKRGEFELLLERTPPRAEQIAPSSIIPQATIAHHPAPVAQIDLPADNDANAVFITSPMVGTLYSASAPDEADFVKVGDRVKEGDVVCIIEAMKVMNEVKSTESGVIKEILIENGHPVEFGTKIFKLG